MIEQEQSGKEIKKLLGGKKKVQDIKIEDRETRNYLYRMNIGDARVRFRYRSKKIK